MKKLCLFLACFAFGSALASEDHFGVPSGGYWEGEEDHKTNNTASLALTSTSNITSEKPTAEKPFSVGAKISISPYYKAYTLPLGMQVYDAGNYQISAGVQLPYVFRSIEYEVGAQK